MYTKSKLIAAIAAMLMVVLVGAGAKAQEPNVWSSSNHECKKAIDQVIQKSETKNKNPDDYICYIDLSDGYMKPELDTNEARLKILNQPTDIITSPIPNEFAERLEAILKEGEQYIGPVLNQVHMACKAVDTQGSETVFFTGPDCGKVLGRNTLAIIHAYYDGSCQRREFPDRGQVGLECNHSGPYGIKDFAIDPDTYKQPEEIATELRKACGNPIPNVYPSPTRNQTTYVNSDGCIAAMKANSIVMLRHGMDYYVQGPDNKNIVVRQNWGGEILREFTRTGLLGTDPR